jgi:hypothetical protein
MKKTKTKSKGRKKKSALFSNSYPAHVLAIVLMAVMFVEGMMFGIASAKDLSVGLEVLDVSDAVVTTKSDLAWLAEPLVVTFNGVDRFYAMASEVVMSLLEDNIVDNATIAVEDINKFYKIASNEMTQTLDLSNSVFASTGGSN